MSREFPDRPIVGVGALIVREGSILLVRRSNPPLEGEWSLPGGVVELGETLTDALRREVREETGLEVEVGDVVEVLDRITPTKDGRTQFHFVLIDYLCRVIGGELRAASDATDVRWARRDELATLGMRDYTIAVIEKGFALDQP